MTPSPLLAPTGPPVPGVERVAVLRANAIGDFVVALPALEALRAAYPAAEITYLGAAWHPRLLEGRPGPWDRVVVVPAHPGVREGDSDRPDGARVRAFLEQQRAERYDLAVQLHGGGGNSNPFVRALGARLAVGSQDRGAPALDRVVPYLTYQHEVLRFLEVVGLVGAVPVTLEPRLTVTDADRRAAAAALPPGAPLVVVHAGATDPRRRWPPSSFAQVVDVLAARGAQVAVVGAGAADAAAAARIAAGARAPVHDLVDRLSLPATLGLLERAVLVVGNDSGPRHLAEAVGTATVAVYWCGNLITAGPLTRARHRVGVSFRSVCPVCGQDQGAGRCPHDPSFVADVPVDEVLFHALDLYGREAATAAA